MNNETIIKLPKQVEEITSQLDSIVQTKRDKTDKIKSSELDTSSNEYKIKPINVSDELLQMFSPAGSVSPIIPNGGVTSEKYADKSISMNKLNDETVKYVNGGISVKNLISIGNMDNVTSWAIKGGGTVTASNNVLRFTPETWNSNIATLVPLPSEKSIYYVGVYVKGNDGGNAILFNGRTLTIGSNYNNTTLYSMCCEVNPTDVGLNFKIVNYSNAITPIEISKLVVINLTENYGYGAEPSATEINDKMLYATNNAFYIDNVTNTFIDNALRTIKENTIKEIMLDELVKQKLNATSCKFAVKAKNNDYCEIITRYSDTELLSLKFQRTGNNNIFNFKHIHILNNDGSVKFWLADLGTDWLGPYAMEVLNNGGEAVNYFTGGNHAYGDSPTGSATGRTLNVKILCDNKIVPSTDSELLCNEIKIEWTNRIQAGNTVKVDGSGREVLEETYTLTLTETGVVNVKNKIVALEDILVKDYYCLQHTNGGWLTTTYYVSDDNKKILSNNGDTNSGTLGTATTKVSLSTVNALEMSIDKTVGVGLENKIIPSIFARGGKSYCYAIKNKTINSGDINIVKGQYKFYRI